MTIYAVFDCMISAMVLHICGQLSVIKLSLRDLANDHVDHSPLFREKLSVIVKRHETLNELDTVSYFSMVHQSLSTINFISF